MSLWDDFTNVLKGAAKGISGGLPGILGGGIKAAGSEVVSAVAPTVTSAAKAVAKPVAGAVKKSLSGTLEGITAAGYSPGAGPGGVVTKAGVQIGTSMLVPQTGAQLSASAQSAMTDIVTEKATTQVNRFDPMLAAGIVAEQKVFSPLIKRPIATAGLLADTTSPLYEDGKFGEGLQPSDIVAAYKRSEKVSLGQSLSKSLINPVLHVTGLSDTVKAQGLDLDKVDLWDDKSIQENFVDNPLGRYMSGLTDAVVGNVAIQVGISGGLAGMKAAARAGGFTTKLKMTDTATLSNLDQEITDHINGVATSAMGADTVRLAASKDINEILDILEPYSMNPRLPNLVKQTEDPSMVRDFMLADIGYGPAIERLIGAKRSDDLWIMSDAGKELSGRIASTGEYPVYTIEQRQRIAAAFDDAIAKNPKHQEIYDAFFRDETIIGPVSPEMAARGIEAGQIDSVPRMAGNNYRPMEPIIGKDAYIAARTKVSQIRTATVTRDFTNVGRITQQIIGRNGAATALIKFATTKMPRGIVTNSGVRPMDAIEEINAHFDDIKAFQSGAGLIKLSPTETMTADQYRKNFIGRYLEAQSDGERGLVLDELNKKLVQDVARTAGITNMKLVDDFVDQAMMNMNRYHGSLADEGYAMDPSGVRIKTDVETQRQLRNATSLLPVGTIERDILAAAGGKGKALANLSGDALDGAFELGNRVFSFTALVRPSYIGKNSIMEPALVSVMSLGSKAVTDMFPTYAKSVFVDNANKVIKGINKSKGLSPIEKNRLIKDFKLMTDQYNEANQLLDIHVAEWVEFFANPNARSAATRADYSDVVKREMNAAERLIRSIEERINQAAPEFTKDAVKAPSLYNLVRRTEYLASLKDPSIGAEIANARAAINKVSGDINTLAPDLIKIDRAIKDQYDILESSIENFAQLHARKEALFSVSEGKLIKPKKQDTFTLVMPNGEKLNVPNFGNKQYFGAGYEAEIANTHTRQIELTGDKIFSQKVNMFNRKGPADVTDITNPAYFDELSYVVNNYMRGDILIDRIIAGESRESLLANWANTRQARSYAADFGKSHSDIVPIVDNAISYVNRYLPKVEAQALAAKGEVSSAELARLLADNPSSLTPIHPMEVTYSVPTSRAQNLTDTIDRLTTAAWVKLATPENKIRYAWASTRYKDLSTSKIEALYAQGFEVTPSVVNGIRQAAVAQTIKELEQTFYAIRRPNRAQFMARTVLAFPTAAASGIYRYSRLAVKNPDRFSVLLNNYYSLYNTFGVDDNGNPVDDPRDATYFIVPGTKEMGVNEGQGLRLPRSATSFLVNFAGPAYTVPLTLGAVYKQWRGAEKIVKSTINETVGHLPGYSYEELFPYGIETNLTKQAANTFTPAWYRNAQKYFYGDAGMDDFRSSMLSEYKYQTILFEAGLGPKPTETSIIKETRKKYGMKALWQFGSIIGTAPFIDTKPDSVFQTLFNAKADEYNSQVDPKTGKKLYTRTEAAQMAEDYLNLHVNLPKGTITSQLLGQKAKKKAFYTPASEETIARIWEDHAGLAKELELLDPSFLGLMTADLPLGTNPQVRKFVDDPNRKLPGGTIPLNSMKNIAQLQSELEKSKLWKQYIDYKNLLDTAAKDADYASYRSVPELAAALKQYGKQLASTNPGWAVDYDRAESGDDAVAWSDAITVVLNNNKYMDAVGKGSPFWEDAKELLNTRSAYTEAYAAAPTGSKKYVTEAWQDYIAKSIKNFDPSLANLINIYFANDSLKSTSIKLKENK
jgi:hypothetical protein